MAIKILVPIALQFVAALGLCFVPLFNVLAYEFCLAITLVATVTSVLIACNIPQTVNPFKALLTTWFWVLVHLSIPLLIISINAIWVQNCNFKQGLGFFALLPLPSSLLVASQTVAIRRILSSARKLFRVAAIIAAILAPLGMSLWNLYFEPPIFVFDHIWGYFSGSLYDEVIPIDSRLLAFRAVTLLRILGFSAALLLWEKRARYGTYRSVLAAASLLLAILAADLSYGRHMNYRVTRKVIEQALPEVVTRPGLVIHLPKGLPKPEREAIVDEHVFRLFQISTRLAWRPENPIHSYVYRDAQEKARLLGGRGTMIAKPWLNEVHIHNPTTPHPILAHELVHAVASSFGSRLLGVSARYGILINMGLVEGLADSLTPALGEFDRDHTAKALRSLNLAPKLQALMNSVNLWGQAPNRAYPLVGSFISHLLRLYGPDPIKNVYAHGDFSRAFGQPLNELIAVWENEIDAKVLSTKELLLAEQRFKRPSIFARPCAHEISALETALARANPEEAVNIQRKICSHLGNPPSCLVKLALALNSNNDIEAFVRLANDLVDTGQISSAEKARLLEEIGNLAWQNGDFASARKAFTQIEDLLADPDALRLNWVKLWAIEQEEPLRKYLHQFLTAELSPLAAVLRLGELDLKNEPTAAYLIARQLHRAKDFNQALDYLTFAQNHPYPVIEAERVRLTADCLWQLNKLDQAYDTFTQYLKLAPTSGEAQRAEDTRQKLTWQKAGKPSFY